MNALVSLALIFFLAIITEGLIEYFGQPIPSSYKPYVAALIGILLCLAYGADILARFGYSARWPYVGEVLTGIIIGRGSNFLNDLVSKLAAPSWMKPNQVVFEGTSTEVNWGASAAPAFEEPFSRPPGGPVV